MKNKVLLITCGIVLLFIITNPSITAFKAYIGKDSYDGLRRPLNFFVYSIYKDYGTEYIGIFGNFIHVHHNSSAATTAEAKDKIPPLPNGFTPLPPKLSVGQFAIKIKAKYPEYKDLNDTVLVKKIIEKYPIYKESVAL